MSYSRTLTTPVLNDVVRLTVSRISVEVIPEYGREDVMVVLETDADEFSATGAAMRDATLESNRGVVTLQADGPVGSNSFFSGSSNGGGISIGTNYGIVAGTINGGVQIGHGNVQFNDFRGGGGNYGGGRYQPGIRAAVYVPKEPVVELRHCGSLNFTAPYEPLGVLDGSYDSGNVEVRAVGTFAVTADSGNVQVGSVSGSFDLALDSGNVSVDYIRGNVRMEADSGSFSFGRIDGDGSIRADSGQITLESYNGRRLSLALDSGIIDHPQHSNITASLDSGLINGQVYPQMRMPRMPRQSRWS